MTFFMLSLTSAVVCCFSVYPHFIVALLYARSSLIQLHHALCLFDSNFATLLADGLLVIIREKRQILRERIVFEVWDPL